jgi:hypothetical protein
VFHVKSRKAEHGTQRNTVPRARAEHGTQPSHAGRNTEHGPIQAVTAVYSKPAQTKRAFYYPQAKTKRATYYPQAQTKRARLITRGGPDEVRVIKRSKRTTRLPAGPDAGAEGSVRGELVVGV